MRKGIVGVCAFMGMALFGSQAMSQTIGVGESSKLSGDQIDEQCVINCLQDDGQSSGECKRADVIACRSICNLPPPATLYIGGVAVNPDLEDPGKIQGLFSSAVKSLGLDEKAVTTYISSANNQLASFGINSAMVGFLTLLNINQIPPEFPDFSNAVVASGEIPCMSSVTYTYPSGTKGLGCREVRKFGATGWAALGCGTASSSTGTSWYGDWSSFCCNAIGRNPTTGTYQAGWGVCTVNSTTPGDGAY
ncbi:MAG TPA: hypothetical protein VFW62_12195 [bacterium]|nr:hypothetical protein [bacterium]